MPVVAVVNRKGGTGKSTLAVHLAAYCAQQQLPVLLGDTDPNQSTQAWLRLRAARLSDAAGPIAGRVVDPRNQLRPPAGTHHVVLDSEGGLRGFDLTRLLSHADVVLIPVGPSVFDRDAAAACWAEMRLHPRISTGRCQVAAVGMRVLAGHQNEAKLHRWAAALDLPYIGTLRDNPCYSRCVERGLSLFDLPTDKLAAELAQWAPIIDWLKPLWLDKVDRHEAQELRCEDERIRRPVDRHDRSDRLRPVGITVPGELMPLMPPPASASRPAPVAARPGSAPADAGPAWRSRLGQVFDGLPLRRLLSRSG